MNTQSFIKTILFVVPFVLAVACSDSKTEPCSCDDPEIIVNTSSLELGRSETGGISFSVTPWNSSCSVSRLELQTASGEELPSDYKITEFTYAENGNYVVYITDANAEKEYNDELRILAEVSGKQLISGAFSVKRCRTGSSLPVIRVTATAPVEDTDTWIPGTMEIEGNGGFEDLPLMDITVKGRGNSTWGWEKKPYALKLSQKKEVLGMPKHKRWCLIANYMDKTLLRNRVAHYIGANTGLKWTPRTQFAEVYFNDEYIGNYLIVEQIKVDGNRVNIDEMAPQDISGDALTGGYLLELDTYFDEVNKFRSEFSEMPVNIKSPEEEITTEQFEYIRNYFNEAEALLFSKNFRDPEKGYQSMFDINSFIDFWIVNEVAGNKEVTHPKSFYIHKPRQGKLTAGPIWDFDYGTFTLDDAEHWMVNFEKASHYWWDRMFYDAAFKRKARERWTVLYPFLKTVPDYIEAQRVYIRASAACNFNRWPEIKTEQPNGDENLSFDAAVDRLKQSYITRINWLNSQISRW